MMGRIWNRCKLTTSSKYQPVRCEVKLRRPVLIDSVGCACSGGVGSTWCSSAQDSIDLSNRKLRFSPRRNTLFEDLKKLMKRAVCLQPRKNQPAQAVAGREEPICPCVRNVHRPNSPGRKLSGKYRACSNSFDNVTKE